MSSSESLRQQGVLVLSFAEPLLHAASVVEVMNAVATSECRKVILDCQAVQQLVSCSLYPEQEPFKPLLQLSKRLRAEGGRLVLCNLSFPVAEVFRITRLIELFEVFPDVATAVDSLTRDA